MGEPPTAAELQQTIREVSRFRGLVLAAIVAGLLFRSPHIQPLPLLFLSGAYLLYILSMWRLVVPSYVSPPLALGLIVADMTFITLAIHFSGGVQSLLFSLYPISIIYSSLYLGYISAFFAATVATLAYGLLLVAVGTPADIQGVLPVQMPSFYILAGLSGYLVERERQQRRQAKSLQEILDMERRAKEILKVTRELSSTLDPAEVLQRAATLACQIMGLARCILVLLKEENNRLIGEASNIPAQELGLGDIRDLTLPLEEGDAYAILREGKPVIIPNPQADPSVPPGLVHKLNAGPLLIVPIRAGDKLLGIMYLDDADREHHFTPEEVRIAEVFSQQVAVAIVNARLYSELQERIQNLLAEMRSLALRRGGAGQAFRLQALCYNGLEIDLSQRQVFMDGRPIKLSWTEFELLSFLAANPNVAFTREYIFRKVWRQNYFMSTNLVDVCIHRLRQKIEVNPAEPRYVITVHGVGYMFAARPHLGPGSVERQPLKKETMRPGVAPKG